MNLSLWLEGLVRMQMACVMRPRVQSGIQEIPGTDTFTIPETATLLCCSHDITLSALLWRMEAHSLAPHKYRSQLKIARARVGLLSAPGLDSEEHLYTFLYAANDLNYIARFMTLSYLWMVDLLTVARAVCAELLTHILYQTITPK